jgi:hypothetical protein
VESIDPDVGFTDFEGGVVDAGVRFDDFVVGVRA